MSESQIDYRDWDWLPAAASEIGTYLNRLLGESGITAHDVSARAKSISSFMKKQDIKQYSDPKSETTDTVAVRIITYSVTDRDRVIELIQSRFDCSEDRNPGFGRPENERGYDCHHFVVRGESPNVQTGWLTTGGKLAKYFSNFGGLEIQVRTVASHAWAEFEHARRYKGTSYEAISQQDKDTIDILFGAAADSRRALDEAFIVIDRILARPTVHERTSVSGANIPQPSITEADTGTVSPNLEIGTEEFRKFLEDRFPDDNEATVAGLEFGAALAKACQLRSIDQLEDALDGIDGSKVQRLMGLTTPVTRVRRLDDELLARFGEDYIEWTGKTGAVSTRDKQLEWRYDRLRGKLAIRI